MYNKLLLLLKGSNLKFRMTEFGTLEILSTVETEKGEVEWSTATGHDKLPDKENTEKGKVHKFTCAGWVKVRGQKLVERGERLLNIQNSCFCLHIIATEIFS